MTPHMDPAQTSVREMLLLLQGARVKGVLKVEFASQLIGDSAAANLLSEAVRDGYLKPTATKGFRLTSAGADRLGALIVREREAIQLEDLLAIYDRFTKLNMTVKSVITRWQLYPNGQSNSHTDSEYDSGVIRQLDDIDTEAQQLLADLVNMVPRLSHYGPRLSRALARASEGDPAAVASPLDDSYHQVWFELHEELIVLLGRTRADEAAGGRAE